MHVQLHCLNMDERISFKIALSSYKSIHGLAPVYLSTYCIPVSGRPGRSHLQPAGKMLVPRKNCDAQPSRLFLGLSQHLERSPVPLRDFELSLYFKRKSNFFTSWLLYSYFSSIQFNTDIAHANIFIIVLARTTNKNQHHNMPRRCILFTFFRLVRPDLPFWNIMLLTFKVIKYQARTTILQKSYVYELSMRSMICLWVAKEESYVIELRWSSTIMSFEYCICYATVGHVISFSYPMNMVNCLPESPDSPFITKQVVGVFQ